MAVTEWRQTADAESPPKHRQVLHVCLVLGYPAHVIYRSPSCTHGWSYKLFAG